MYFSAKFFMQGKKNIGEMMRSIYPHKALVPAMNWLPGETPPPPIIEKIQGRPSEGIRVIWKDTVSSPASYYVLYRFKEGDPLDIEDPSHIVATIQRTAYATQSFVDDDTEKRMGYTYVVTGMDRLHNESAPSAQVQVKTRGKRSEIRIVSGEM